MEGFWASWLAMKHMGFTTKPEGFQACSPAVISGKLLTLKFAQLYMGGHWVTELRGSLMLVCVLGQGYQVLSPEGLCGELGLLAYSILACHH